MLYTIRRFCQWMCNTHFLGVLSLDGFQDMLARFCIVYEWVSLWPMHKLKMSRPGLSEYGFWRHFCLYRSGMGGATGFLSLWSHAFRNFQNFAYVFMHTEQIRQQKYFAIYVERSTMPRMYATYRCDVIVLQCAVCDWKAEKIRGKKQIKGVVQVYGIYASL